MFIAEKAAPMAKTWHHATPRIAVSPFVKFAVLTTALSLSVFLTFVLSVVEWSFFAAGLSALVLVNAVWISGGAATAILGLLTSNRVEPDPPIGWQPAGTTAILVTLCGENPASLTPYLADFLCGAQTLGIRQRLCVFVISDTSGQANIVREVQALTPLIAAGAIISRRRATNKGKKPGNIADWLETYGADFDFMVTMDADSRMTASSIKSLIWRIEHRPNTGLLQAGISLIPAKTRFGRHQRIASRLLSPNFVKGYAAWVGKTANYWGHNAIIRIAAFRGAACLPHLSGSAPLGGAILSHDFVEAAWTLNDFFQRDRRWCQGNLQHLRNIGQEGLHPLSRFHLATGIFSYVAAPIWLLLVICLSTGVVTTSGYVSILMVAMVLVMPKICALIDLLPKARTRHRCWITPLYTTVGWLRA